jgi:hypothetical protein
MKHSLLIAAVAAIALTACGEQKPAPKAPETKAAPAATPAPTPAPEAKKDEAPKAEEKKDEKK